MGEHHRKHNGPGNLTKEKTRMRTRKMRGVVASRTMRVQSLRGKNDRVAPSEALAAKRRMQGGTLKGASAQGPPTNLDERNPEHIDSRVGHELTVSDRRDGGQGPVE